MRIDRKKLLNALVDLDLTQTRLAELSGISRATISMILHGKSCSKVTAKKISDALGVELSKLIEK